MKVLITGANGFIGRSILSTNINGISYRQVVRNTSENFLNFHETFFLNSISSETDWSEILENIDAIVHLAGRAHVLRKGGNDPSSEYKKVNVDGTINLVKQAILAGVKRFIFMSSIKVNGETTSKDRPFTPEDKENPMDPYAESKYKAEKELIRLTQREMMDYVILRPTLVYGSGVKANFLSLVKWIEKSLPLPFGAVRNLRSFLAVGNLVDFIHLCLKHNSAANQIFLVSDGAPISTSQLVEKIKLSTGSSSLNIPVNSNLLRIIFRLIGRKEMSWRLLDSMVVDISKNKNLLGWKPATLIEESLKITSENLDNK